MTAKAMPATTITAATAKPACHNVVLSATLTTKAEPFQTREPTTKSDSAAHKKTAIEIKSM